MASTMQKLVVQLDKAKIMNKNMATVIKATHKLLNIQLTKESDTVVVDIYSVCNIFGLFKYFSYVYLIPSSAQYINMAMYFKY